MRIDREPRDALALDHGERLAGIEALDPYRCTANHEAGNEAHREPADPEQRLARIRALVGPELHALRHVAGSEADSAVEMRHTLGIRCRARGVNHQRHVGSQDIRFHGVEQRVTDRRRDAIVMGRQRPARQVAAGLGELDPPQARHRRQGEGGSVRLGETRDGRLEALHLIDSHNVAGREDRCEIAVADEPQQLATRRERRERHRDRPDPGDRQERHNEAGIVAEGDAHVAALRDTASQEPTGQHPRQFV